MRATRRQLPDIRIRRTPWGFSDPEITLIDRKGAVTVEPLHAVSDYRAGAELDTRGFDGHVFRRLTDDGERLAYLHACGYAAVPVDEGFVVRYVGDPSVDDEDGLRSAYRAWSSRRTRDVEWRRGWSPYPLNQDARVALAVSASENGGDHMAIAAEYIAFRDAREGVRAYDSDLMHRTILTANELSVADRGTVSDAAADVLGCAEREDDPEVERYLKDLGDRIRRLS